jgi:hypothetical protein
VGTYTRQLISDSHIARLYRGGASRFVISKLAGLTDYQLVAVLRRNAIPLRSDAEWREIARNSRMRWIAYKAGGRAA